MSTLRRIGIAVVVPLVLVVGGCSAVGASQPAAGTAEQADGRAADVTAEDSSVPQAKPGEGGGYSGTVQVQVARTASVGLTVSDVEAAATKLRALATAMGGVVTTENLVSRVDAKGISTPTSTMVISVPSDRLDSTLEQLKSMGTITSRVISSDDVTTQVADVASRVKALEGSIARLNELSKKAGSITELTQLEAELSSRIEERDSLLAQQKALAGRVAQSPITISLQTPEAVVEAETPGFLAGLAAGWNALVTSSRVLLTIVGAVLPFLVLVAAIGIPVVIWRRRRARRVPATVEPVAKASASTSPEAGE
jgi:PBP1b-binding outer membrane lipoprotein LpoB